MSRLAGFVPDCSAFVGVRYQLPLACVITVASLEPSGAVAVASAIESAPPPTNQNDALENARRPGPISDSVGAVLVEQVWET